MSTFTDSPWDGAASKYKDTDAYCSACLIDENAAGAKKVENKCHLPVKEPSGAYNKNALRSAAGALQGSRGNTVQASPASKKKAARALLRLMSEAKMTPGDGLKNMAS